MWGRLCKALGREDLTNHPDYATREARRARRKEVNCLVQEIVGAMDTVTVTAKLQAAEVPCGPINAIDQAFNDPQVKHLELVQTITTINGKETAFPRQPFRLSRTPSKLTVRTPEFAEHTDEVLAEFGFSTADINGLRDRGAVE
jgi:formyl-CoA transferase